ncbi:hypothetical protein MTR_8g028560 [Medicago truncatula]|uniref:Uncharacterized protein n=1 Tax=Medicago truncatula TaxID=3880 RepID=A0A072TN08_MEDTR|nr:hypothetical protein MTR_8g028560 [Medicago truncatula]
MESLMLKMHTLAYQPPLIGFLEANPFGLIASLLPSHFDMVDCFSVLGELIEGWIMCKITELEPLNLTSDIGQSSIISLN